MSAYVRAYAGARVYTRDDAYTDSRVSENGDRLSHLELLYTLIFRFRVFVANTALSH